MEGCRHLIVVGTLLDIISLYLSRRDVAILKTYATVGTLIVDMIVIEKLQRLNLCRIGEIFVAIKCILIGINTATSTSTHHKLKHIGKQIHLCSHRLYRIVETSIGIVVEVELTIDISTPIDIFRHLILCRKRNLSTSCHSISRSFLLCIESLHSTLRSLCRHGLHHECHHENC